MSGFDCMQGKIPEDPRSKCPTCGIPNKCGVEMGKGICWCFNYPAIENMNSKDTSQCVCESCYKKELDAAI